MITATVNYKYLFKKNFHNFLTKTIKTNSQYLLFTTIMTSYLFYYVFGGIFARN